MAQPASVSTDDLEKITDKLISDSDVYEKPIEGGDDATNTSGPVTTYDELFSPPTSTGNLFDIPPETPFKFDDLKADEEEKELGEPIVKEGFVEEEIVFGDDDGLTYGVTVEEDVQEYVEVEVQEEDNAKLVSFQDLPENPPELTVDSVELQPREGVVAETVGDDPPEKRSSDNNYTFEEMSEDFVEVSEEVQYPSGEEEGDEDNELDDSDSEEAGPVPEEVGAAEHDRDPSEYDEADEFDFSDSSEGSGEDDEVKKAKAAYKKAVSEKNAMRESSQKDKTAYNDGFQSDIDSMTEQMTGDDIDHKKIIEKLQATNAEKRNSASADDLDHKKIMEQLQATNAEKKRDKSPPRKRGLDSEVHSPELKLDPENPSPPPEQSKDSFYDDEAAANPEAEKEGRRRLPLYILILGCCIITAVIVVLVVLSQREDNDMPIESIPITPSPSFLRSPAPAMQTPSSPTPQFPFLSPPTPSAPTPGGTPPSGPPPTPPTQKPTSAPPPTPAPTPVPGPPFNDICRNAIGPLPSSGISIGGTIASAGIDNVDRCGDLTTNGAGVWYTVLGTGGEMLAHTCLNTAFDSKITIFKGSCSKPECLEANDNFCGSQSAVSWQSNYRQVYRILVHGPELSTDGAFELTIESRYNDECTTAVGPLSIGGGQPLVLGDTFRAHPNSIACDGQVNESPSVFYHVRGTGGEITASVCEGSDFNVRISLLTGECDSLLCLSQTEITDCSLTWASLPFFDYYLLIHGDTADDIGNFGLRLTTTTTRDNDECPNALGPLQSDGTVVEGSTSGANADILAPFCLSAVTGPGVWYYVRGNGLQLQASLCGGATYDTRLSIYEGECPDDEILESLICVDGNDDFCGIESLVTWPSEDGKIYYILVHGYLQATGDFALSVSSL